MKHGEAVISHHACMLTTQPFNLDTQNQTTFQLPLCSV